MMLNQLLQVYVGTTIEEIPHGILFLQTSVKPQHRRALTSITIVQLLNRCHVTLAIAVEHIYSTNSLRHS